MHKRTGESPTKQEGVIIKMFEQEVLSCFQIAQTLALSPVAVYRVIDYWCNGEAGITYPNKLLNQPKKEDDMAKGGDKNKAERTKNMAKLREGEVFMASREALTDAEIEQGWVLTCQAKPTTQTCEVEYED